MGAEVKMAKPKRSLFATLHTLEGGSFVVQRGAPPRHARPHGHKPLVTLDFGDQAVTVRVSWSRLADWFDGLIDSLDDPAPEPDADESTPAPE